MKKKLQFIFQLNATSIAFSYLLLGIIWILFSDQLLEFFITDLEIYSRISSIKGIFYVLSTTFLLYFLVRSSNKVVQNAQKRVNKGLELAKTATWSINLGTHENIISANHHKLFGLKNAPKKWTIKDFYSHVHPDYLKEVKQAFREAIENHTTYKSEYKINWDDGTTRWLRSQGAVEVDEHGEAISIAGIIEDITDKKELEAEYARESELFELIFEQIPVMVDIYDTQLSRIRVNKAFEETLGWTNTELKGIDLLAAFYPDTSIRKKAAKAMDEANGQWHTFEVMDKAGNTHIQEWSNIQLSDSSTVGIGIDVTEKVHLHQKLKEEQEELKNVNKRFERAEKIGKIGHVVRNLKTGESTWSNNIYELGGFDKDTTEPSLDFLINQIHPEDRKEYDKAREAAYKTGELNQTVRFLKSSDELIYVHVISEIIFDAQGIPELGITIVQDITKLKEYEQALEERKKLFENTIEHLPIGVSVNHIDSGETTLMNKKFSEIYGWSTDVIKDIDDFFLRVYPDEEYRKRIMEMITSDIASGKPNRMQWEHVKITTATGEERIVNAKNIPIYRQNLMISTVVDVTAQVEAEQRLTESENNYRLLFQKSPQPMLIYDPENLQIIEVNDAAVKHYGYPRNVFYKKSLLDIRPEEDREKARKIIEQDRKMKLSGKEESRHLKKSGEIIHVRTTGAAINYFGQNYRLVLVNDITEQRKAEEMVLASLVEGENKERARIARELHDGLGQYLAAANMNLDAVQSELNKFSVRKQEQYKKGLNLLKNAVSETAQISRNLLPRVVDDYGLALAIESLVDNYSSNTDISIHYFQNLDAMELPQEVEFNLYRIAQEGLSNAIKYSGASQINIQLIKDGLDLMLTIDDNGIGFDQGADDFKPGLGLQTINTRVGALGGFFEFESKPNHGTFLNITVPLNK